MALIGIYIADLPVVPDGDDALARASAAAAGKALSPYRAARDGLTDLAAAIAGWREWAASLTISAAAK